MIKLVFALRRLPELSRAEFQRYWRENHAPLVQKNQKALRIQRYVQVHSMEHPIGVALRESRGGPDPYDGVAELWWNSADDLAAALSEPEAIQAGQELLNDERRFIDLARSPIWLGEEHTIISD